MTKQRAQSEELARRAQALQGRTPRRTWSQTKREILGRLASS